MRASPAFHVTIRRCGAWRVAVGVLTLLAAATLAAWGMSVHPSVPLAMVVPIALLALAVLVGAASVVRCPPMRLRWDTRCWHLAAASAAEDEASPGRVAVALDLGAWMLLKFEHDPANRGRRTTWLPVQRRGLEAQWHALRCAVYSARSAPGHDAGPNSAIRPESQE